MMKQMMKFLVVSGAIVILVFAIATRIVERFYPKTDLSKVNEKIETIEGYGFDTFTDMTENGIIIEKDGPIYYMISDRKSRILNELNTIIFRASVIEVFATVVMVTVTEKNKKRDVQWASLFLFCFKESRLYHLKNYILEYNEFFGNTILTSVPSL